MVFTGIEVLFFILGVLTTLFIVGFIKYNKELHFKALTWATLGFGAFLLIFCVAWSVSSVLEGVPRAASMGLVVFGIPSIILLLLGRRIALKGNK
jgi:hypothetical protein